MNAFHIDSTLIGEWHHIGPRHYTRLAVFLLLYSAAGYGAFWLANHYPGDAAGCAPRN